MSGEDLREKILPGSVQISLFPRLAEVFDYSSRIPFCIFGDFLDRIPEFVSPEPFPHLNY